MTDNSTLPIHPTTGLQAIGFTSRGPIWPVAGGSGEGEPGGIEAAPEDGSEVTPPEKPDWWQFNTKEDAVAWGNGLVQDRLKRDRKTHLDPITAERDTLKAEVERLKPFEEATLSDTQRREARKQTLNQELSELREFKTSILREKKIAGIAAEEGLDPKFLKFVNTAGDDDAVRESIKDLLNVLSEDGSDTKKRAPKPKAPKDSDSSGGGTLQNGGGGGDDESDDAVAREILEQVKKDRINGGLTTRR